MSNKQINALIPTKLDDLLELETSKRQCSKTAIIIDALKLYFDNFDQMKFLDELTSDIIEDDSSIMIPKALYMKVLGIKEKEIEIHIKKSKLQTIILDVNENKQISYIKLSLNDKKSMFKMLIQSSHEIEKLRLNLIEHNQKFSAIESKFEQLDKKLKENET